MSILADYLEFTSTTEPPPQYHRWCFLSCVGARIGRNLWIPFGHGKIYPNMYTMLVGVPGTRKTTAINIAKKILRDSDYGYFGFTKTSKQKFLIDLDEGLLPKTKDGTIDFAAALDEKIVKDPESQVSEVYVASDEFVDFIGIRNIDFINLLTTLWDNQDKYDERLKNSKSVCIQKPTVNLLGGITPTSFAQAMPQEIAGQGFLSRLILVYGEPPQRRITWPRVPEPHESEPFVKKFRQIAKMHGEVAILPTARDLIDKIYQQWEPLDDIRLQYYGARRLTHMLKLCIILAALRSSSSQPLINENIVCEANTILSYTEQSMHSALGEFGSSKNSVAMQKIVEALSINSAPMTFEDLWKSVQSDLERYAQLADILQNLQRAGRIKTSTGQDGKPYVSLKKKPLLESDGLTDFAQYIKEYTHVSETLTVSGAI